jgi:hypothetical protein
MKWYYYSIVYQQRPEGVLFQLYLIAISTEGCVTAYPQAADTWLHGARMHLA